jgi:hypothetical protein
MLAEFVDERQPWGGKFLREDPADNSHAQCTMP